MAQAQSIVSDNILTPSTGAWTGTVTGAAGKTWCQSFWYDGTVFLPCGAKIQID